MSSVQNQVDAFKTVVAMAFFAAGYDPKKLQLGLKKETEDIKLLDEEHNATSNLKMSSFEELVKPNPFQRDSLTLSTARSSTDDSPSSPHSKGSFEGEKDLVQDEKTYRRIKSILKSGEKSRFYKGKHEKQALDVAV